MVKIVPRKIREMLSRVTGTTPQTSGIHLQEDKDWRDGCGYNVKCKYDVIYDSGTYTGRDEEWAEVGIPHGILHMINNKCPGNFGWRFNVEGNTKYAIISFDDKEYAFWFRLKHSKQ